MANVYINSEQITSIASSLKSKGNSIVKEYKSNCTSALEMSKDCIQLSGLNTDEFFKALDNVYQKLNDKLAEFADFLTNTVAAEYDITSQAIVSSFNDDFADEISKLLGVSVSDGSPVVLGKVQTASSNASSVKQATAVKAPYTNDKYNYVSSSGSYVPKEPVVYSSDKYEYVPSSNSYIRKSVKTSSPSAASTPKTYNTSEYVYVPSSGTYVKRTS